MSKFIVYPAVSDKQLGFYIDLLMRQQLKMGCRK